MTEDKKFLAKATFWDIQGAWWRHGGSGSVCEPSGICWISILDGSDLYQLKHGSNCAREKESVFHDFLRLSVEPYDGKLIEENGSAGDDCARPQPWFCDGELVSFSGDSASRRALAATLAFQRLLTDWNIEHELGWEHQVHARFGIARRSWRLALALAQQAQRNEVVLAKDFSKRLTDFAQMFLSAAMCCRIGTTEACRDDGDLDEIRLDCEDPVLIARLEALNSGRVAAAI